MAKKLLLFFSIFNFLFLYESVAQQWNYNKYTGTGGAGYLGTSGGQYDIIFGTNSTQQMILKNTSGALGIGYNYTPSYQLDVYSDITHSALKDINVSCPTCNPVNAVGYRIGGEMVLWTGGIGSNLYVGVNAGNATSASTNNTFVGDDAGYAITTGGSNTAIGYEAYYGGMGGSNNTAVGAFSLFSNSGDGNTAVGYYSLHNNTGNSNTATGTDALYSNTSGGGNTATGYYALLYNTTGLQNTATGARALISNTSGQSNTATGYAALNSDTSGTFNTASGVGALSFNTSGNSNTATGGDALYSNTTGNGNTASGYIALERNTVGNYNTADGYSALFSNTSGSLNTAMGYNALLMSTASNNTAIGSYALYSNTLLNGNTAVGDSALFSLSFNVAITSGNVAVGNSALYANQAVTMAGTPSFNTAVGQWTMRHNTAGVYNTAYGGAALYSNTSGSNITAEGVQALYFNTMGANNTANGYQALFSNTTGSDNVASGFQALYSTVNGSCNTAVGNTSGYGNTGSENTFVGYGAGYGCINNTTGNDVFLGYNAGPSVPSGNTIYLGNPSTSAIETYASISLTSWSDRRVKDSIKANVPGLAFIDRLKPITFHYNIKKENQLLGIDDTASWPGKYDVEKITQSGFIAQQVDSAAQACGYNFCGVTRPKNSRQPYTLGYTTFVVPLVKAVQELNAKNDSLRSIVDSLRNAFNNIQTCLSQLCGSSSGNLGASSPSSSGSSPAAQTITLGSNQEAILYQNRPNPFNSGTQINYFIPQGDTGASIVFYDSYGNRIKTVPLTQTGNGTLNVNAGSLSNGIYSYSLVINGSVVDTKRMEIQR